MKRDAGNGQLSTLEQRQVLVCSSNAVVAQAVVDALAWPWVVAVPPARLAYYLDHSAATPAPLLIVITDDADVLADLSRLTRTRSPEAYVLALGLPDDDDSLLRSLAAGADGVVSTAGSLGDVLEAIGNLSAGRSHLPVRAGRLAGRMIAAAARRIGRSPRRPVDATVSAREKDIVALLAERRTNKEIAVTLRLELQTVKNHVSHVLRKLGLRSRYEVARTAARAIKTPSAGS